MVELQIVILAVAGSSPVGHPTFLTSQLFQCGSVGRAASLNQPEFRRWRFCLERMTLARTAHRQLPWLTHCPLDRAGRSIQFLFVKREAGAVFHWDRAASPGHASRGARQRFNEIDDQLVVLRGMRPGAVECVGVHRLFAMLRGEAKSGSHAARHLDAPRLRALTAGPGVIRSRQPPTPSCPTQSQFAEQSHSASAVPRGPSAWHPERSGRV